GHLVQRLALHGPALPAHSSSPSSPRRPRRRSITKSATCKAPASSTRATPVNRGLAAAALAGLVLAGIDQRWPVRHPLPTRVDTGALRGTCSPTLLGGPADVGTHKGTRMFRRSLGAALVLVVLGDFVLADTARGIIIKTDLKGDGTGTITVVTEP